MLRALDFSVTKSTVLPRLRSPEMILVIVWLLPVPGGPCRMKLLRIDSIPLPYNDEMMAYYISLAVDNAEFMTFLLYITLEFPQCEPLGVYFTVK